MSRVIGSRNVMGSPVTPANVREAVGDDVAGIILDLGLGTAALEDTSFFAPAVHNHDDLYYTEAEIDTALALKSDATHTHTGAEVVTSLGGALAAIPDDTSGSLNQATVNAILAGLRTLGVLTP